MEIVIKMGDITAEAVDAIVNAANAHLAGGGGVDGAIHRAGGPQITQECRKIGSCPTGQSVVTTAGAMPAKWVIHTVGPVWHGGKRGERDLLESAYQNSLLRAREIGAQTVAFPSISTGAYGFPIEQAAPIALRTAQSEGEGLDEIRFLLYSKEDLDVYKEVLCAL